MPSFQDFFMETKGQPIEYGGETIIMVDKVQVNRTFSGTIEIVSTNSEWEQGVSLAINKKRGYLEINGYVGEKMSLWQYNSPRIVHFAGESKDGILLIYNLWRIDGVIHAGHNGAAMFYKVIEGGRRYFCNDGHPDDNFDDIVFEVFIDP